MIAIRAFFPKIRALFSNFQNMTGQTPPPLNYLLKRKGMHFSGVTAARRFFNPFVPNALFLYPLKTSAGIEKECVRKEWVKIYKCCESVFRA